MCPYCVSSALGRAPPDPTPTALQSHPLLLHPPRPSYSVLLHPFRPSYKVLLHPFRPSCSVLLPSFGPSCSFLARTEPCSEQFTAEVADSLTRSKEGGSSNQCHCFLLVTLLYESVLDANPVLVTDWLIAPIEWLLLDWLRLIESVSDWSINWLIDRLTTWWPGR